MSCGGTPPITSTWPDCRAPVRTLDSGMIVNDDLVEVGLAVVGAGLGPQAYPGRLSRTTSLSLV